MADANRHTPPPGWGDAFSGLPLESPPVSRWPQIQAALQARDDDAPAPSRSRTWLALAASLFALALVPLAWVALRHGATDAADIAATPNAKAPATHSPTPATVVSARTGHDTADYTVQVADLPHAAIERPQSSVPARAGTNAPRSTHVVAHATPPKHAWPQARVTQPSPQTGAGHASDMQASFESLYTDAAQLEQLLSLARDTRVASGPVASLAGALDADLAAVDAQLAEPGLSADQRLALWRTRVDLLRESAAFESQLRLLAADGRRLDGAVAEIH